MPTVAVSVVQTILEGLSYAPGLINSATTLFAMFAKGSITEDELLVIWTANVKAVQDAEAAWHKANPPGMA